MLMSLVLVTISGCGDNDNEIVIELIPEWQELVDEQTQKGFIAINQDQEFSEAKLKEQFRKLSQIPVTIPVSLRINFRNLTPDLVSILADHLPAKVYDVTLYGGNREPNQITLGKLFDCLGAKGVQEIGLYNGGSWFLVFAQHFPNQLKKLWLYRRDLYRHPPATYALFRRLKNSQLEFFSLYAPGSGFIGSSWWDNISYSDGLNRDTTVMMKAFADHLPQQLKYLNIPVAHENSTSSSYLEQSQIDGLSMSSYLMGKISQLNYLETLVISEVHLRLLEDWINQTHSHEPAHVHHCQPRWTPPPHLKILKFDQVTNSGNGSGFIGALRNNLSFSGFFDRSTHLEKVILKKIRDEDPERVIVRGE